MRNERRILRNTAVLCVGEGAGQLANFILVVSFARAFGPDQLGFYSVGMAVGALGALFVSLGTQGLLIREISRKPLAGRDLLGVLFPVQLMLGALAWLAASATSMLLTGDAQAAGVVMAACGYQVLCRLAALLLTPIQANEQLHVFVAGELSHRVFTMLLGLTAIRLGAGAGTVALALVAGALVLMAFAWTQASRRFGRPALRFAPSEALRLFRFASPFFGVSALAVMYTRGAMIMLSALAPHHAVGLYAVADRFMVAVGLAPSMLNTAAYPALARVAHSSLAEARALSVRCLRLMLVGTIPLATLITIFSADIVRAVFGLQYSAAVGALQVLIWSLPLRGAQSLLGSQLAAMDRQAALARARLAGLCTFLVLAPLMILNAGHVGAAWAVLLCDGFQLALYWTLLRKAHAAPSFTAALLAPTIASAATVMASTALSDLALAMRLLSVCLAMAVGLWVFGAVRLHDLRFLLTLICGKGPPRVESKLG